ncbi:MAG: pilus assembly protein TadG-related protein, partial [Planctomycetota bacterium]
MRTYATTRPIVARKYSDISPTSDWDGKQRNVEHISRFAAQRYHGVALIWAAIILLMLILIVGLGLDSAKGFYVAHQLQNAADAAALSAAQIVKLDPNEARLRAIAVGMLNFADRDAVQIEDNPQNLPDGDVVIGRYDRDAGQFTPSLQGANAVKVVARRLETSLGGSVPINFGPIAGVDTVNIERYAIAITSGGSGAGIICLRPDEVGFLVNGD